MYSVRIVRSGDKAYCVEDLEHKDPFRCPATRFSGDLFWLFFSNLIITRQEENETELCTRVSRLKEQNWPFI